MAALGEHFADAVFFAKVFLADVVDLQAGLGGEPFGMGLDAFGERLDELLKIEDADAARRQIGPSCHRGNRPWSASRGSARDPNTRSRPRSVLDTARSTALVP